MPPPWRPSGGSFAPSSRRPTASWSWKSVAARVVRGSSGGRRARATLAEASDAELEALGPCLSVDPDRVSAHAPDDDPPFDRENPEWQQEAPPEWVVTGFPGCDPSPPVSPDEPRAVDDDVVI